MGDAEETMTVMTLKQETPDVASIMLSGKNGSTLTNRKSGQYVMLSLRDGETWTTPRPFSISNPAGSEIIQLTVNLAGELSNMVHALQPGREVKVSGPFGNFCSGIESNPVVMIAGGIGITPFLSVLRHYQREAGLKRTTLFWTNPRGDDFFALAEIDSYYFLLDFTAVIVSETRFYPKHLKKHRISSLNFEVGLLSAELFKRYADFSNAEVLVCGPGDMQEYVYGSLQECGVNGGRIQVEKFDA